MELALYVGARRNSASWAGRLRGLFSRSGWSQSPRSASADVMAAVACALLLVCRLAPRPRSNVDQLIERLKNGEDFRVRVQAALRARQDQEPGGTRPARVGARRRQRRGPHCLGRSPQGARRQAEHPGARGPQGRRIERRAYANRGDPGGAARRSSVGGPTKMIVKLGRMRADQGGPSASSSAPSRPPAPDASARCPACRSWRAATSGERRPRAKGADGDGHRSAPEAEGVA